LVDLFSSCEEEIAASERVRRAKAGRIWVMRIVVAMSSEF